MISPEISFRQRGSKQQRFFQPRYFSDCLRNISAHLECIDTAHYGNIASAQWLGKCYPGRTVDRMRNSPRSLFGAIAIRSYGPCAIPRSRQLSMRGGRKRPRENRCPGEHCPGGRKAGERITDPSHAVSLAAPAVRRNRLPWNIYRYLRQNREIRALPHSNGCHVYVEASLIVRRSKRKPAQTSRRSSGVLIISARPGRIRPGSISCMPDMLKSIH